MNKPSLLFIEFCAAGVLLLSACQTATPTPTAIPMMPSIIAATPIPPPTAAPQHPAARSDATRLDFSSTTMNSTPGKLDPGQSLQVVFNAEAGRRIDINTAVESGSGGIISLWGADAKQLVPEIATVTNWKGTLPTTQDYYLNLRNTSDKPLTFRLTIKVPPVSQPAATRVQFKANSTGGSTQGELAAGSRVRYVLRAMAGQQMDVTLETSSAEIDAYLYFWSEDGSVYTLTAPVKHWNGMLPATQDYYIELVSAIDQPVAFRLTINISAIETPVPMTPKPDVTPKIARDDIIRQDAGPLEVILNGTVISGQRDRYTFNALKGEKIDTAITSNEDNAVISIIGPDNKPLPGTAEGKDAKKFTGSIPADGVYAILVGATRGNAIYAFTVKIKN